MNYGIGNVKGKSSGGGSATNYFLVCALIPTFNSQLMQYEIDASYVIDLATQQPVDLTNYDIDNNKYEINIISPSPTGEVVYEGKFLWRNTDFTTTPATLRGQYIQIVGKQLYQHNITAFVTGPLYLNMTIITDSNTPMTASSILQWLKDKGFTETNNKWYSQFLQSNTSGIQSMRCRYVDDTTLGYIYLTGTGTSTTLSDWTITDTPIAL